MGAAPNDMWVPLADRYLPNTPEGLIDHVRRVGERVLWDIELMNVSGRWLPGADDPHVYLPGDVPALRSIGNSRVLAYSAQTAQMVLDGRVRPENREAAFQVAQVEALPASFVHMAKPFFMSPQAVASAAETDRPPAGLVDGIRLPFEAVWVVFGADFQLPEGMTWPAESVYRNTYVDQSRRLLGSEWELNVAGAVHERGGLCTGSSC